MMNWATRERKTIDALRSYLTERFSEFALEHEDEHFDTGNYYFRFYRKGQGLRVEFTRIAVEDQSPSEILRKLEVWSPPSTGNVAVCVYTDRIESVPWDRNLDSDHA